MDWEKYRNEDDSIDLIKAWEEENSTSLSKDAVDFIRGIEKYQKIKSRQAAAIILGIFEGLGGEK